jgi:protein-disulfide isomerase
MSEATVKAMPRRGRIWVIILLVAAVGGLGYALVNISTQKPNNEVVHIAGIETAQGLFGGVPQEGDRVGSSDAPVTVQIFNDMQCGGCQDTYLETVPALVEKYARAGNVQFIWRNYSNSENKIEFGFYGAEAAAEQGYGWQYAYLFFRNQDEAEKFGVDQDLLESIAGGVEELNFPEWEETYEKGIVKESAMEKSLQSQEELGEKLGIRTGQALVLNGPSGSETLQDSPSLEDIEAAIAKVE